jgi:hypothetical protein
LLLHALALSWWWAAARRPLHAMPGAAFQAPAGRAPAMVWIATSPPLASAAASATPLAQLAGPQPATSVRTAPARKKQAVAVPALAAAVAAPPAVAPQAEAPLAAPAPQATASEPARPLRWGAEELRRAAGGTSAQERQQARIVPHQRWTANAASNGATGGDMRLTEQYGAGGTRVTRVQRGVAVYCVEVPSANQPPAMGAAPRIVLPRNCS